MIQIHPTEHSSLRSRLAPRPWLCAIRFTSWKRPPVAPVVLHVHRERSIYSLRLQLPCHPWCSAQILQLRKNAKLGRYGGLDDWPTETAV